LSSFLFDLPQNENHNKKKNKKEINTFKWKTEALVSTISNLGELLTRDRQRQAQLEHPPLSTDHRKTEN